MKIQPLIIATRICTFFGLLIVTMPFLLALVGPHPTNTQMLWIMLFWIITNYLAKRPVDNYLEKRRNKDDEFRD